MKGDNIVPWSEYAKAEWDRMTWTAADPLTVEDPGPWPNEQLERSRDTVLVCLAGMAIIAILAFLAGRAS